MAEAFGRNEANDMKKTLGIVAIGLVFSVPAYAQGRGGGFMASSSSGALTLSGGSVGGGAVGGESRANIRVYSPATFGTAAFSGGDASFAPSSFLTFEQAVEVGKAELAPRKTVAQAAAETVAAMKAKSRVEFVQDNGGKVVPLIR